MRKCFSRTTCGSMAQACRAEARGNQPALACWLRRGSLARVASEGWWSQTGSNRRPHACKARALPAELWPRNRNTKALVTRLPSLELRHAATLALPGLPSRNSRSERRLVGLGRLELPTSRLSSARSNQLSYKPLAPRSLVRASRRSAGCNRTAQPPARVRPRRKRNEDGEIPPLELNNPKDCWPLNVSKTIR